MKQEDGEELEVLVDRLCWDSFEVEASEESRRRLDMSVGK